MNQFGRVVLGYHGCPVDQTDSIEFMQCLIDGTKPISEWQQSEKEYDWLGDGVYFWEYGPARAQQWAGEGGSVVGALIQLGRCFDLTDPGCEALLRTTYDSVAQMFDEQDEVLPDNLASGGMRRNLDRLIVNQAMSVADSTIVGGGDDEFAYQTVRCAFEEGEAAFPGSMLRTQTHIQIAVRDLDCILGVFRPNFNSGAA